MKTEAEIRDLIDKLAKQRDEQLAEMRTTKNDERYEVCSHRASTIMYAIDALKWVLNDRDEQ
jgi:c-di-AMP phosphodiesterase-like protein